MLQNAIVACTTFEGLPQTSAEANNYHELLKTAQMIKLEIYTAAQTGKNATL